MRLQHAIKYQGSGAVGQRYGEKEDVWGNGSLGGTQVFSAALTASPAGSEDSSCNAKNL